MHIYVSVQILHIFFMIPAKNDCGYYKLKNNPSLEKGGLCSFFFP